MRMIRKSLCFILLIVFAAGHTTAYAYGPATSLIELEQAGKPLAGDAVFHSGKPSGVLLTEEGLLITDTFHKVIWKLNNAGHPLVYAGRRGIPDPSGEPLPGYNDAIPVESAYAEPWGIVPFQSGYLVTDPSNHVVRMVSDKKVFTAVGDGKAGLVDNWGVTARLNRPTGLAADEEGNVYIADTGNHAIRKLDNSGNLTTLVGAASGLSEPTGLCYANGVLYAADSGNNRIVKITEGQVQAVATGLNNPQGLVMGENGFLYIADTGNSAIKRLSPDGLSSLQALDPTSTKTWPVAPRGLALDGAELYIADNFSGIVIRLLIPELAFDDVSHNSWYAPAVSFAAGKGLFSGTAERTFAPDGTMTRGMLAQVLRKLHLIGQPTAPAGGNPFSDIMPDAYYKEAVSWAADKGLLAGVTETTFAPDRPITREELCTILYRYAVFLGLTEESGQEALTGFSDYSSAAPWARPALSWAVKAGLVSGSAGRLNPKEQATRAQTAQILMQLWPLIWK